MENFLMAEQLSEELTRIAQQIRDWEEMASLPFTSKRLVLSWADKCDELAAQHKGAIINLAKALFGNQHYSVFPDSCEAEFLLDADGAAKMIRWMRKAAANKVQQ